MKKIFSLLLIILSVYIVGNAQQQIVVGDNNLKGLINNKGELIAPCLYDSITLVDNMIYLTKKMDKYGFIDTLGVEIVKHEYDYVDLQHTWSRKQILVSKDGKYGVLDHMLEEFIPCVYDSIIYDHISEADNILALKDNKWQYLSKKTGLHVSDLYDKIEKMTIYDRGENVIVTKNGKKGVFSRVNETEITPCIYDDISHDGGIGVCINGKWGSVNWNGKEVIKPIYDFINRLDKNLFLVKYENKYQFIDSDENVVLKNKFELAYFHWYPESTICYVKDKNGWYLVDYGYGWKNKEIKPIKFSEINTDHDDFVVILLDGKYGIVNRKTEEVIWDFKYKYAITKDRNRALIVEDDLFYLVDIAKKKKLTSGYKVLDMIAQNVVLAFNDKTSKYGLIDIDGNILAPFDYDGVGFDGARPITKIELIKNNEKFVRNLIDFEKRSMMPPLIKQ